MKNLHHPCYFVQMINFNIHIYKTNFQLLFHNYIIHFQLKSKAQSSIWSLINWLVQKFNIRLIYIYIYISCTWKKSEILLLFDKTN